MSKYEEDNSLYNDGEDRKPKLLILLGAIIIIVIILVLVISCGMKTKSSNNYLSYLKVNNATLTPAFDKNTTVYSLTTKEDVVAISCASESAKATTSGCNKRITLYDKSLTHTITVIAEDKGVRTYKISITKEEGSETPVVQITSTIDNNNTQKVKEAVLTSYVLPSDSVVTYQWYKNNEKIEGATSSEYKVTSTGDYYVEISKEGMQTPVASNVFTVNIEEEKENTTNKNTNKNTTNKKKNTTTNKSNTSSNNNKKPAPYTLSITKVNGNSSKWVKSVTLTVEASSSNGLNSKAYSFDGGKTYQSSNSKTFTNNQTVNIVIRDIKGNKTSKKVRINKIDNTKPKVSINATNKTSNSVVLNAVTNPNNSISGYKYQWYKNNKVINGARNKTYKASSNGNYSVRVTTGVGNSAISSSYQFTIVIKPACPTLSAKTESGKSINDKTWTNEKVLIKIIPSKDTVSYDVYINESNIMNNINQNYRYYATFNSAVQIRLSNKGMRMIKIVSRDKNGNSSTCYSKAYYIK